MYAWFTGDKALCSVTSMLPTFNRGKLLAWEGKERTTQSKSRKKGKQTLGMLKNL